MHQYTNQYTNQQLRGPLFFGSTQSFQDLFSPSQEAEQDVVVDFLESRVWDHSALEAIDAVAEKYTAAGKTLHLQVGRSVGWWVAHSLIGDLLTW
jgi:SulP family sulfate permease